jgi:Sulfotransferase family
MAALPDAFTLLMLRAARARSDGALALAIATYQAALELKPHSPVALRSLIELTHQMDFRLLERVLSALNQHPAHSEGAAILRFAAAKACDDLGEYRAAWHHLKIANELERATIAYRVEDDLKTLSELAQASAPALAPCPYQDRQPIFIVGMPRSGSTLIERILSAHPTVRAGGELPHLPNLMRELTPWHAGAEGPAWGQVDTAELRARYLELYKRSGRRWTDKQLLNFAYLPWALAAFPGAMAIHARREPLATIYGMYRQRFQPGTWPFAYSLSELTDVYIAYRQLMSIWQERLGSRLISVDHGQLCADFEPTVRALLKRLELGFSYNCLNFPENPAPVDTMSASQVRRRIFFSTQYLRYMEWLAPVAERLKAAGI